MLFEKLNKTIENLDVYQVSDDRNEILLPLIEYIQSKVDNNDIIRLNFICTHNSRRSHLSQVWAQAMAAYYNVKNVYCYSGGTQATAMFPMAGEALIDAGFKVGKLSESDNPIYQIKYAEDEIPVIGFSKCYDDEFNPKSKFAAIMTCNNADEGCPFIPGTEKRIPIKYDDPKAFDNTPIQKEKYIERSLQIATEMKYVFSNIKF